MKKLLLGLMIIGFAKATSGYCQNIEASNVSNQSEVPSPYHLNYWSMFTGPGLGQSFVESKSASGEALETGSNYFQSLFVTRDLSAQTAIGVQLRTSSDFLDNRFSILNPRITLQVKNVIDTKWLSLGLQPFIEIPTTSVSRGRAQLLSTLFAQNWTIKTSDSRWTLFVMTMVNANFYRDSSAYRTIEWVAMPMVGYQVATDFQLLAWGWFDWAHYGGSSDFLGGWNDNYLRVGVNYSVTKKFQIYPCVQFFTDNATIASSTLGLELSAQI